MRFILIIIFFITITACRTNISDANLDHQEIVTNSSDGGFSELMQTDANRIATLEMRNNLHSFYVLLDKLYKRNPKEWKKTAPSQEQAKKYVFNAIENNLPFPSLNNKKSITALYTALSPEFKGDRAGALIYASATMLIEAHGGHSKFYISDILDGQYLHNAARNIEIAQWMLRQRKDNQGNPLLLSNEITDSTYNITFAIETAKIVARLDLVAAVVDERYKRVGVNYVHNLLFLTFLPVQ